MIKAIARLHNKSEQVDLMCVAIKFHARRRKEYLYHMVDCTMRNAMLRTAFSYDECLPIKTVKKTGPHLRTSQ